MELFSPNLARDEDSAAFLDALTRLRDDKGTVDIARAARDTEETRTSHGFWSALVEQGWTAAILPEELGGLGQPAGLAVLGARELGRSLVPVPFTSSCSIVPAMLRDLADTELAEQFVADPGWWAVAIGSSSKIEAKEERGRVVLNGSAEFIPDVVGATRVVCLASGAKGPVLALAGAADLKIELQDLADRRNRGRAIFQSSLVRVLAEGAEVEPLVARIRA